MIDVIWYASERRWKSSSRAPGPPASLKAKRTFDVAIASFVQREICFFTGGGLWPAVFRVLAR